MKYLTFEQHKKELLRDPDVRREYERLGPEYDLIESMIKKRIEKKMSQADLARKMGTKQSAISRVESGTANPSLRFMQKIADAFGSTLSISFK
jgi:ribosome-binding protein aMBF1 (putative translation factor)